MKPWARLLWWETRASFLQWEVRVGALFGLALLWAAVVAVAAITYLYTTTWDTPRYLAAAWRNTLEGKRILELYPPTERNETAVRLEELALGVGVNGVRPQEAEDSDDGGNPRRSDTIDDLLEEYWESVVGAESTTLATPPEEALAWLDRNRPQLDQIVALLIDEEPPIHQQQLASGWQAPQPNLLAVLHLGRRLLLAATDAMLAGEDDAALRILLAFDRMSLGLWKRPGLLSQLIAHYMIKERMALLRRRPWLGPAWARQTADIDPRAGMLTALRLEAWVPWQHPETLERSSFAVEWIFRLMVLEHARILHDVIEAMAASDIRGFHPDEFFAERFAGVPRWNIASRILFPNLFDSWPRSHRAALEIELTRRLVAACADPDGSWLATDRLEPSTVEGLGWTYRRSGEDLTISLDGDVDRHYREDRVDLPTTATVDVGTCRAWAEEGSA